LPEVSPCFTPGTLIATDQGWRPVETLRRGQKIVTRDNGLRRISWIGRRDVPYEELTDEQSLQPVMLRRGSLGPGSPSRDMLVSPNHRFLVKTALRGGEEVLMAARDLIDRRGIFPARVLGVSYLHILAEAHEVILANGAWTESFHPDDVVLRLMARRQRQELLRLFPEVATHGAASRFPAARDIRSSKFDK
jgi:glycine/D-amino acid oxidase-like deaminating enzyme